MNEKMLGDTIRSHQCNDKDCTCHTLGLRIKARDKRSAKRRDERNWKREAMLSF